MQARRASSTVLARLAMRHGHVSAVLPSRSRATIENWRPVSALLFQLSGMSTITLPLLPDDALSIVVRC